MHELIWSVQCLLVHSNGGDRLPSGSACAWRDGATRLAQTLPTPAEGREVATVEQRTRSSSPDRQILSACHATQQNHSQVDRRKADVWTDSRPEVTKPELVRGIVHGDSALETGFLRRLVTGVDACHFGDGA